MKVLVVSATAIEIGPLVGELQNAQVINSKLTSYEFQGHEVHVLVSGVGMVATAYWMGQTLAADTYEMAFNFGIAGSFDRELRLGEVVHVAIDRFSEVGVEHGANLVPLSDTQGIEQDQLDMEGEIHNSSNLQNSSIDELKKVTGVTVNRVHGNEQSIDKVITMYHPEVESMEGASFLYSCRAAEIPCAQIRSISNYVEKRNIDNWNIPLAVERVNETAINILKSTTL